MKLKENLFNQSISFPGRVRERSPPPMKRLRLRGDWSDTGPNARPETQPPEPEMETPEVAPVPRGIFVVGILIEK